MAIRVTTRHSPDFDIYSAEVDPSKSSYASIVDGYTEKVRAFYDELGIAAAIWATPESNRPEFLEHNKHIEYLVQLSDDRIAAYVDESTWSAYLYGQRDDFTYSREPAIYDSTSLLIRAPILCSEVLAIREYRQIPGMGPDHYELIKESVPASDCT